MIWTLVVSANRVTLVLVDLSGEWQATPINPELTRTGADPDLDDSEWERVPVPGHWAQNETFADEEGPLLYRYHFEHPRPEWGKRLWLKFDGVTAQSDVWLDGSYVGDTRGYFVPHQFDVSDAFDAATEHVLSVEVAAPPPGSSRSKRSITGSLQQGPLAPPGSPGGIWKPVTVTETGTTAILHSRLLCTRASEDTGEFLIRLVLDTAHAGDLRVHTSVTGPFGQAVAGGSENHTVANGENRLEWTVEIDKPQLWWPAQLGEQPMYEVAVAVCSVSQDGTEGPVSDRVHWRTGIRTVSVNDFTWRVNGKRIFIKGISVGPQSRFLSSLTHERIRDDIVSAKGAGLNLLRVQGHIAPTDFYRQADELGMLVWQDLPLMGGYATTTRTAALELAREVVDLVGHHPSISVWCAHDNPNGSPVPEPGPASEPTKSLGRRLGRHLLPSWNRSVLDPYLRRELRGADKTRSVIARSGSLPTIANVTSSDAHLWLGWHAGNYEDLAEVIRRWPRLGLFLGGFGSQSAAVEEWDEDAPEWETAMAGAFERYLPRQAYANGPSWAMASRAYQADLIRSQIETVRRLKYRPTGGFCLMALADAEPSGGFGVLDHGRQPKPAYEALTDACDPVVVIGDTPPTMTVPGEAVSLMVHVVSDLPHRLEDVKITATASAQDWEESHTWIGDLPPDTCAHVGTLKFVVPKVNGPLIIDLALEAGDRAATNRYQTIVIPPSEAISRTAIKR